MVFYTMVLSVSMAAATAFPIGETASATSSAYDDRDSVTDNSIEPREDSEPEAVIQPKVIQDDQEPKGDDDRIADKLKISVDQVRRLHTRRAINNEMLEQLPLEMVNRVVRPLALPDIPHERALFRTIQDRDENGVVPAGAKNRAIQRVIELRREDPAIEDNAKRAGLPIGSAVIPERLLPSPAPPVPPGAAATAGLTQGVWQSLGPGNIGGRVRSMLAAPEPQPGGGPHILWAGSVGGGIWKSIDNGQSWLPADDKMANLAVSCIVIDPTDAKIMYAGTGEGFSNLDALRGAGIFKSTDRGNTWKQLPSTNGKEFWFMNRLAISRDGKVLLAATSVGLFRSTDGGTSWKPAAAPANMEMLDVDFHATDPNHAVASGRQGRAFFSSDAGKTWTRANGIPPVGGQYGGRIEITYARANNGNTVYASLDNNLGQLYRSDDGGKTYLLKFNSTANKNYLAEQGWYSHALWAGDPQNADFVIVGGIDLWKSTDGGSTLTDISTWWAPAQQSAHADHHVIVAHPRFGVAGDSNAKTVYFGNDGGIYMTKDVAKVGNNAKRPRTNGWMELVNTLGVTQFYSAAGNASTRTIVAGAQDNGTLRFTPAGGSEHWTEVEGGDGGFCAADPGDSKIFYGEYVYLTIFRNDTGGEPMGNTPVSQRYIAGLTNFQTWSFKDSPYRIDDAMTHQANFIAPFVLDPNDRNRILAGGLSLWRTRNARQTMTATTGPTWRSVKPAIGSDRYEHPISAIAVAKGDSKIIWVGHNNGNVYKTTNGTAATPVWTQFGIGQPSLPNRYCHRITIDPSNPDTVYITFGGYASDNVWKTTDGGTVWQNMGASLPEAPVRTLAIHPGNRNYIYIGTEVGVFASEDGGQTWSATNEGPTNCSADDLFFLDKVLYAATHGRGLFRIDLSSLPAVP